jgi:uncharacterized phage protein gp47/JayE
MTIADLVYIDQYGYHYADYPTFLAFYQAGYQNIYGADTYLGADSMDGQWVAFLAQSQYDTAALGAQTYNSFSPATAQGVGLSQNVQINGIQREIPSNSTVVVTIGGVNGTTISNGIALDENNNQWILPSTVTIPFAGAINVTATAQNAGDITAPPGTVNVIFTPTQGWQTVTNAAAAVVGTAVEQDGTLRARQQISTANPSTTVLDGTEGAVANVSGVNATEIYENYTDETDANGLPPHSFCVVCNGGNFTDIATAIMLHKTPGTNPFAPAGPGYRQVQVLDPRGMPINIQFYNPPDTTDSEVAVQIEVDPLANWSVGTIPLIQAAVSAFINSLGIGGTIYPSALYSPALLTGTPQFGTFQIASLQIKFVVGGTFDIVPLTPEFNAQPNCSTADVTVTT